MINTIHALKQSPEFGSIHHIAAIEKDASIEPIYNTAESSGVSRMRADLTQATNLLNYTPRVSLAEGLQRILAADPRFA